MPHKVVRTSIGAAASRVPGLRRLPMLKLLAAGEIVMIAREHFLRLSPRERRRLFDLVRIGRGRRRNLSAAERDELAALIHKVEPRLLAGRALERLSPVPVPQRLVRGPRKRTKRART